MVTTRFQSRAVILLFILLVKPFVEDAAARFSLPPDQPVAALRAAVLQDLSDGTLDSFTLIDASLIASGVADSVEWRGYQEKVEALWQRLDDESWSRRNEPNTGKRLLQWLHKNTLHKYNLKCTDLRKTLGEGDFNCVTSTILYKAACDRLGLQATVIETPVHVFCKLGGDDKARVIETTLEDGFDYPDAFESFRKIGLKFKLITQKELQEKGEENIYAELLYKRKEIASARLVALIFSNHATELAQQENYPAAFELLQEIENIFGEDEDFNATYCLIAYEVARQELLKKNSDKAFEISLTGMSKAPRALQQTLELRTLLGTTAADVISRSAAAGDFPRALAVMEKLGAFPEVATSLLQTNKIDILRRWTFHLSRQGKIDSALIIIEKAWAIDSNHIEIKADRARLYGEQVSRLVRQGQYELALEKCQAALRLFPDNVYLRDLRIDVLLRHSYSLNERGAWDACIQVLQKGRALEPDNDKLTSLIAWTHHQQTMELIRQEKWRKALDAVKRGLQDCPDHLTLREDQSLIEKSMRELKK